MQNGYTDLFYKTFGNAYDAREMLQYRSSTALNRLAFDFIDTTPHSAAPAVTVAPVAATVDTSNLTETLTTPVSKLTRTRKTKQLVEDSD